MGSCNYSVFVTRLSIICFLFLSVVILLQVYEHRKREYQFHKRSIREYVQIRGVKVSASIETLVVFNDGYTPVKALELKGVHGITQSITYQKADSTANDEKGNQEKVQQQYYKAQPPPEINATHINGILMEPVNANYTRNIYFTVKTTHKYYTERLFPLMLTWLQVVDRNKVSYISLL